MSDIAFAAIDWGTTTYRLWLIDRLGVPSGRKTGPAGLKGEEERNFEAEIEAALKSLACPAHVPVLMCGMIGAKQGWVEAPYLQAPCSFGSIAQNSIQTGAQREVTILPGICQRSPNCPDVMRGEETILAGLFDELAVSEVADLSACLPGTHSKWARIKSGRLHHFQTFMTGEVFALLSQQSVLSAFTSEDKEADFGPAFETAVVEAFEAPHKALNLFFSCRSIPLVESLSEAVHMRARLSGLLIGLELSGALEDHKDQEISLVASGALARLYERALNTLSVQAQVIEAEQLTRAGLVRFAKSLWPHRFFAQQGGKVGSIRL